ncbi:hypothetical protein L7F22_038353 [Adiantum nelumboides]|nr:hypothetical protein [Adiantum nelumboides]
MASTCGPLSVVCVLAIAALVFAPLPKDSGSQAQAQAHELFNSQKTVNSSHKPPVLAPPPSSAPPPIPSPIVAPPPPINCTSACAFRCHLNGRPKICIRACQTCCYRCKCVPPGTSGNQYMCGSCYTNQLTHKGRSKCP